MLTVLADGTKPPAYVILRRKPMPKENLPSGVTVWVQEKGWMEAILVLEWLNVVWGRKLGMLSRKRSMLELYEIHELTMDLIVIPGSTTLKLQVLDAAANKPFKDSLRKKYCGF